MTECANALLQDARRTVNTSDYLYVAIVADPVSLAVEDEQFRSYRLPDLSYMALSSFLTEYAPPIAAIRRGRPAARSLLFDAGTDLLFGMVAIRSEVVELFLPFRVRRLCLCAFRVRDFFPSMFLSQDAAHTSV